MQGIKKRLVRILLTSIAASSGVLLIAFVVLQMPTVQKLLIDKYLGRLKNHTHFEISAQRIHLYWYDRLQINGLKVVDPEKNQMISIDKFLVNFQFFHVRHSGQVNIDGVSLDSANVKLVYIAESDTTKDINLNEFIAAMNKMFATLSMTEVRTWKANCDGCTNPTCKVGGSPTLDPSDSFAIKGCTMDLKNNQLRWVACCLIFCRSITCTCCNILSNCLNNPGIWAM